MATVVIDPVTRIEGHLKVEVLIDGGYVKEAKCSGVMFRGFELLLKNRDPRDAQRLTQRVCGVCPAIHATAAALALDNAFGIDGKLTQNGRIIRNLILGSNYLQSHILHFYHLAALDYVDVTAAADYQGSDADLQSVSSFLARGALEPFVPRCEGDYRLTKQENRAATAHYVQALRMRRKAHEMLAIFGGKMPHDMGIVPGGVTVTPSVDKIAAFYHSVNELGAFVENVYLPDVLMVAGAYKDYFGLGKGADTFLCYGAFDLEGGTSDPLRRKRFFPGGVVDGGLNRADVDAAKIIEYVTCSWYEDRGGNAHPTQEETIPAQDKPGAYSWLKAPRYDGKVTEVGPLARVLAAYVAGHEQVKKAVDEVLTSLGGKLPELLSVCGRHAARAIEAKILAAALADWVMQIKPREPAYIDYQLPAESEGAGLADGPRGALGHWIRIKARKIDNYQLVVPTTWNASPRDAQGQPGPIELALTGIRVRDENNPFEIVRIVRSFDPCLACSVHAVDWRGRSLARYRIA